MANGAKKGEGSIVGMREGEIKNEWGEEEDGIRKGRMIESIGENGGKGGEKGGRVGGYEGKKGENDRKWGENGGGERERWRGRRL